MVKELRNAKEFVFADQILRSATSIGANVAEAGAGQSKKDFIHKMAIASKEARETRYWLRLLNESKLVLIDFSDYLEEIDQIIKILTKIVKTSQQQFKT
ncbi:four helix bundle protein [Flagellimonas sp.]|uniref:four helix bundle protein n=1 Tax=Flagellimonas sp. TaxID=2058762 RepID=UPI003B51858E